MKLGILIYIFGMTAANLIIVNLGPSAMPFVAFFLIGLELSLRDYLHLKMSPIGMGVMIVSAGVVTFILNPAALQLAIASSVAFTCAALTNWGLFVWFKGTWLYRVNGSNVFAAGVDSLLFPTLAFGIIMPGIVLLQFAAKIIGGGIWSIVLYQFLKKEVRQ